MTDRIKRMLDFALNTAKNVLTPKEDLVKIIEIQTQRNILDQTYGEHMSDIRENNSLGYMDHALWQLAIRVGVTEGEWKPGLDGHYQNDPFFEDCVDAWRLFVKDEGLLADSSGNSSRFSLGAWTTTEYLDGKYTDKGIQTIEIRPEDEVTMKELMEITSKFKERLNNTVCKNYGDTALE